MTLLSSTSLEMQLLLCCACADMDDAQTGRLRRFLAQPLDWTRLLAMAAHHGLRPLLYHHLTAHTTSPDSDALVPDTVSVHPLGPSAPRPPILGEVVDSSPQGWGVRGAGSTRLPDTLVPDTVVSDTVRRQLHLAYLQNVANTLMLNDELGKILTTLNEDDIPVIPYKGVALGAQLYGDATLRVSGDIDIIVPIEYVLAARDRLLTCGYQPLYDLSPRQEQVYLQGIHHYNLVHTKSNVSVEVHWDIVAPHHALQIEWPAIWQRMDRLIMMGDGLIDFPVRVFAPEDHLLLLLIHGSKHRWESLKWLVDVGLFIDRNPSLDWDVLIARAGQWRARRMALLGLQLAHDLLGASLPSVIWTALDRDHVIPNLIAEVVALVDAPDAPPEDLSRIPFVMRLHEDWRTRFTYGWRLLTHVSFLDVDDERSTMVHFLRGSSRRLRKRGQRTLAALFARMTTTVLRK